MAASVTHAFVSPVVDELDPNKVGPDEWNDDHVVTGLVTELLGASMTLTIVSGVLDISTAVAAGCHNILINGEGAANDDLLTISGGVEGYLLRLRAIQVITLLPGGNVVKANTFQLYPILNDDVVETLTVYFESDDKWVLHSNTAQFAVQDVARNTKVVVEDPGIISIRGVPAHQTESEDLVSGEPAVVDRGVLEIASESGTTDDLTGMTHVSGNAAGMVVYLVAQDTHTITIKHLNAGSAAGSRMHCSTGADIVITGADRVLCVYDTALDSTDGAWYAFPLFAPAGTTPVDSEVPSGTVNGVNDTFTLAATPASGSLHLYKNGLRMKAGGNDYTLTTATIVFVASQIPATGDLLLADYRV